jgi:hypothetical protein
VDSRQLVRIFGVGVFPHREPFLVREVPRVDPDLLDVLHRLHRRGRREVDVGDERNPDPA